MGWREEGKIGRRGAAAAVRNRGMEGGGGPPAVAQIRRRRMSSCVRAPQLQTPRLWSNALAFGCVAGFVVTVLATFQDQLVFYLTPTDALVKFSADPSKSWVRLGGLVLEGSVVHPSPASLEIKFVVMDLITGVLVCYEGVLPDLFHEGHSVVVEGFLMPFTDDLRLDGDGRMVFEKAWECMCFLRGTEVLAKHDERYMPDRSPRRSSATRSSSRRRRKRPRLRGR